ncbi:unnamed protein product [Clonostachys byssicola]|uniref:Ankyrin n=1 Tax=Clonostachys byssicola TaxID=160290 RepID=A0A9N9UPH1_9HYPO|nr:unnamed protein product [Clonostachys byssicola]
MQGKSALSEYIRSRSSQTTTEASRFLKLVFREQLISPNHWVPCDTKILKSLLSTCIGIQVPHSDYSTCCIKLLERDRFREDHDDLWVLNHLFQNGLVVTSKIFGAAVSTEGTDMLDILRKHVVDVGKIGGPALAKAAGLGNYEAVDWLLGFGVDIKSPLPDRIYRDGLKVNTVMGMCMLTLSPTNTSMLRHLARCDAELKRTVSDQHAGDLFGLMRITVEENYVSSNVSSTVPWLLDQLEERGTEKMLRAELQALYALTAVADRCTVSEKETRLPVSHRVRKTYGLPPYPEAILGPMIAAQVGDEMIQELIRASIGINTYPEETFYERFTPIQAAAYVANYPLVVQLFKIGADVNAPARGKKGRTALQAICEWNPLSEEEKSRQHDIVNFLIKKGANINAGPVYGSHDHAAITTAAIQGNIELVTVLLAHGADPNIYPWQLTLRPYAALDLACGSCDMTKLLLNAGALSSHRGSTGYEGALLYAEFQGHNAVAGIIRDHMLQKEEQFRTKPELRDLHNAVIHKLDLEDASRHANETYDEEDMKAMKEIERLAGEHGLNYPPQPRP